MIFFLNSGLFLIMNCVVLFMMFLMLGGGYMILMVFVCVFIVVGSELDVLLLLVLFLFIFLFLDFFIIWVSGVGLSFLLEGGVGSGSIGNEFSIF